MTIIRAGMRAPIQVGDTVRRRADALSNGYRMAHDVFEVRAIGTPGFPKFIVDWYGENHDPDNLIVIKRAAAPFPAANITRAAIGLIEVPVADPVNHPSHYKQGGIEVIDIIEAFDLGPHEANVIKYILRAPHKGATLQDYKKARWYLDRKISNMEAGAK